MVRASIPELPFAHTWIASQTANRIPKDSILHLAIYNSLRNWNFFEVDNSVIRSCNTGGFGIDGILSTLVGASLAEPNKICFAVIGDLAFFYDINVAGNRHVSRNVRILLVNNGKGTEFRNYNHPGAAFGDDADLYIAAGGHFGNKSRQLVKHYAEDLGYEYMSAENKEEYLANLDRFVTPELTDKPMLFEVFTTSEDESDSLMAIRHSVTNSTGQARNFMKSIVGDKGVKFVKKILK
jgi:2-succinyl-5-enolpyruvyl-6-hydroxy-3-cyclohexene-1-carboxylate synthase